MKLSKRIRMFVSLFFNINKNYFFEKYKFIRLNDKYKRILFAFWYIFKNQLFVICSLIVLQMLFKSDILNSIVTALLLLSMLLGMDTKEWRLFHRADFVSELPEISERFFTVLLGNVVLKLFVENNLILLCILLLMYTHSSMLLLPIVIIAFIIIYCATLSIFFIMQSSTFTIKKIFSLINYLFSFVFTIAFIYYLLDFVLSVFITFSDNLDTRNVLPTFVDQGIQSIESFISFIISNKLITIAILIVYVSIVFVLNRKTINYLRGLSYVDKEDSKYIVENFIFVKMMKSMISRLFENRADVLPLINKEFALFTHIYKYNFKDYFFIFIADRSLAFLISILLILIKFEYNASYLIAFLIVPIILLVDTNSNVGVKLITNMSFITDYNTLLISNTSGFNLKNLIQTKLYFYYAIKLYAYIIYIVVYNIMFVMLGMPVFMIIVGNIAVLILMLILPKIYLTNNLIYSRMNYKNYQKYLDESKILDVGVSEFYPLNMLFKVWIIVVFLTLMFTTLLPIVEINVLLIIILVVLSISILLVYIIMTRIHNNIIKFIERGNYSADFAKIFKE